MIQPTTLSKLKQTVMAELTTVLPDVVIQDGWRREQFFGRPDRVCLILSLAALTAEDGGFYGTETTADGQFEQAGTLADCTLRLTLLVPQYDDTDVESTLETACAVLAASEDGDFYRFSLQSMRFSESLQCFEASLDLCCRLVLLRRTESTPIRTFSLAANPI